MPRARLYDLDRVKRAVIAPRSTARKAGILAVLLLVAWGIRFAIDRGQNGVPYVTFYPVILVSAIFLGGRYAVAAALASSLIVSRGFMENPWIGQWNAGRAALLVLFIITVAAIVLLGQIMRALVLESEESMRQQEAFNAELQHRAKNSLQIMRALIARGPRGEEPNAYFQILAGRLDALAAANELLRFGIDRSAPLPRLVNSAIKPFEQRRIHAKGPDCEISKNATTPLMMALHELCTNATKYGALSAEGGSVDLRWTVPADALGLVELEWVERGGPPVTAPTHRGLGARLLTANGGLKQVDLDWRPEGLCCRLAVEQASSKH